MQRPRPRFEGNYFFCCPSHTDYDVKRNESYPPHEIESYHPELVSPCLQVWPFIDSSGRLDSDQEELSFQFDNLDLMLYNNFFLTFVSKICQNCSNDQLANCNPPCLPVAVKSPIVSKEKQICVLTHFKICVGKCCLTNSTPVDVIVCGCLYNVQGVDYRKNISKDIENSLVAYNSSNYSFASEPFNLPYKFLVIPRYGQILKQFLKWVIQKYPNLEIYQSWNSFKSTNPDFMKIRFDMWSTFRYMIRKIYLEETGLSDVQNWNEWPPVCR